MSSSDPAGELLAFSVAAGPVAGFSVLVPPDLTIVGFALASQALHLGGVQPYALSNAQDLVLGTY